MAEKQFTQLTQNVEAGVLAHDDVICDMTEAAHAAILAVLAERGQRISDDCDTIDLRSAIFNWLDDNTEPA